jgi:hypothetical protein
MCHGPQVRGAQFQVADAVLVTQAEHLAVYLVAVPRVRRACPRVQVGRQRHEPGLREAAGHIVDVRHQPERLMDQDQPRVGPGGRRLRQVCPQRRVAGDFRPLRRDRTGIRDLTGNWHRSSGSAVVAAVRGTQ